MKKIVYLLLAAVLLFSVAGCGNQESKKETSGESSDESSENKLAELLKEKGVIESEEEKASSYQAAPVSAEIPWPEEESDGYDDEEYADDYSYDYDYSDTDYYEDGYDDGGYDDGGYYVTGEYDDGNGGYRCDYGTYCVIDSNGVVSATMNVYNWQGSMSVDFGFWCGDDYDYYATGYVYTDATEAFGDASRNTEVEMYDVGDEYGGNYYSDEWMVGGLLTVIVYWPEDHAYFKFVGGDGRTFEFDMYP